MTKFQFSNISRAALAVSLAATFHAAPAFAQDAEPEAQQDGGLAPIVVTAQRREENLQEVPVSVATLGGDTLNAITSTGADVRALAGRVPSLNVESSFGRTFPRFYIRGLGNGDFDLNASQPVSVVYDDVVLENPILKGFPVFDLDRIEVLRGPQGTLFGRNTPAGIVKFDTVKPGDTGGFARASYGTYGTSQVELGVGAANESGFSVRVSGLFQHRDNWIDNLDAPGDDNLGGYNDVAARLQLQYESGPLTARATGQVRVYDGSAVIFRANSFQTGSNDLSGAAGPGTPFERDEVRADGINFQKLNIYNAGLNLEYDFGAATLYSITSFWTGDLVSRGDIDGGFGNQFAPSQGPGFIPFSAQTQDNVPGLDQFTQEIRIASNNDGGLGYQAGFFYFDEDLQIETLDYGAPQDTTPAAIALQDQESRAFGVFASVNYKFDNGLKLQAGARYNDDKRDFTASRPVDNRPGFLGFGGPVAPISTTVKDEVITWDVSAGYAVNDDVNLFARVARGYRAPSIQGRLAFGRDLSVANSERTMSYEAGFKTALADNRVRFNLTGYYFTTEDLQLTAVGGASNFTQLINAADVNGYGVEAEFEAAPVDNLQFAVSVGYNDTEINDPNLFVAGCGAPCTVLDPERTAGSGIYSIDGNQLPQSPKWTVSGSLGYSVPVGAGEIYAFTDWYYRSRIQFFLYNSVEFSDDSLIEGGLRLGYRTTNEKLDIAAFVRNITNDESAVGGIDFNNLTGFVNEPRIYGVSVGTKF